MCTKQETDLTVKKARAQFIKTYKKKELMKIQPIQFKRKRYETWLLPKWVVGFWRAYIVQLRSGKEAKVELVLFLFEPQLQYHSVHWKQNIC